jgi:hypothetical protein
MEIGSGKCNRVEFGSARHDGPRKEGVEIPSAHVRLLLIHILQLPLKEIQGFIVRDCSLGCGAASLGSDPLARLKSRTRKSLSIRGPTRAHERGGQISDAGTR